MVDLSSGDNISEKNDDASFGIKIDKSRNISLKDLLQVEFHFPDGKIIFRKGIDYYPEIYDKAATMAISRKEIDAMRNRVIDLLEDTHEQKMEWD